MKVTQDQVKEIMVGNYKFTQLGFSMLVTRLKNQYKQDPSQTTLQQCTQEINVFLDKFMGIMEKDYTVILNICGEEGYGKNVYGGF